MQGNPTFDLILGLCRCREHAQNYHPNGHNRNRTYYFVEPNLVPSNMLCGACLQQGNIRHGGLIISEESYYNRLVAFTARAGYQLSDKEIKTAIRIWPRK
jgi:hypothetical protein